ncbi:MAG: hypothetical protein PHX43_00140 [Alphaproteobacteria bacterium]|nr:hypothetical protein [Alphaproteobacteria bacterium]
MVLYLGGELRGNIDWSILPSSQYGIPNDLTANGFEPLYIQKGQSGWDGQFYYYIANDILAQGDTKYKVEMSPYRYQRIGVSLLAKIASAIMGYDYVPVAIFYLTSAFLVLAACFFFSRFLQSKGYSAYLALLWSLASGTQMTIMNGLPDAGADALLLMAMVAIMSFRHWLYAFCIALCTLSREIYIIIPAFIALAQLIKDRKNIFDKKTVLHLAALGLPLIIFGAWHLYIKIHFSDMAPINAFKENLLTAIPLSSWVSFTLGALIGEHRIFGNTSASHYEAIDLLSFIGLLGLSFWFLIKLEWKNKNSPVVTGTACAFLVIFTSYLFFGDTVMRHHTGFLKTISICFACIIFCHVWQMRKISRPLLGFLLLLFAASQPTLLARASAPPSSQMQYSGIYDHDFDLSAVPKFAPCSENLSPEMELTDNKDFYKNPVFARITGQNDVRIMSIKAKNGSKDKWPVASHIGPTALSYFWKERETQKPIFEMGFPSFLQKPLLPGEERTIPIVLRVPKHNKPLVAEFFIYQANCPRQGKNQRLLINFD